MGCSAGRRERFGHNLFLPAFLCVALVFTAACERRAQDNGTPARTDTDHPAADTDTVAGSVAVSEKPSVLDLSSEETVYLEALRDTEGLKAAIGTATTVFEPSDDGGEPDGFHYHLVRRMAEDLGIRVDVRPVRFMQFFSKDGVVPERAKTDPDFRYVPDLLGEVDLYVGTLSILPWRDAFLRFIPLYHTRLVYVYYEGEEITEPHDLSGRTVALLPITTYESWLKERAEELHISFDTITVGTGDEAIAEIAAGRADVAVSDADIAIRQIRDYPSLTVAPAGASADLLCWAVAETSGTLAAIIEKYITAAKADGTFARLWEEYFEFTFYEYLGLVGTGS